MEPLKTTFKVWFEDGDGKKFYRLINEETEEDACIIALDIGVKLSAVPLYPFEPNRPSGNRRFKLRYNQPLRNRDHHTARQE